ncbi:MAG: MBL fold metallo-hydrolase, partial [Oscillospiraceae bacterium]|nr:MBL fold metallo-hydrolase [Oscillospiraceae bacterium]
MQGYLETPGLYDPSVYSQFLTCLQDSIALFKKYNPIPTAQIGAYEYVQESIDQAISDLNSYASRLVIVSNGTVEQEAAALRLQLQTLPADGQNLNGRVRLVPFSQSADGSKDIINLKGKHYLVLGEGGNHYVVNANWTDGNGELPLKLVTVDDTNSYSVITDGAVPSMAFTFSYRGVASNGMPSYVLRFHNSTYLGVGTKYSNWNNLYYVKQESASTLSAAPQIRLDHPSGVNWVRISNVSGTHGLRQATDLSCMRWKDNSAGDNDYAGNALFLYRIWSTKSLLTAIKDMSGYLDTPEFFDEEVFRKFLTCMKESIALFEKYNVSPTSMIQAYDFIQDTLDQKEAELRAFASQLSFQVSAPSSASLNTTTKIHQLPLACCYVIQTRGGKIIIIDGGWQENNTEGKYLFSYLQKITGDSTPHIDAWFITHAHADHHGCVPTFADLYKDQVTIDAFYFHYPTYEQISKYLVEAGVEGTWGAADWLPSWIIPKFKNAEGGPTKCITVNTEHSGLCDNSFDFDEVHIDILLTFEDVVWAAENVTGTYSGTSENAGRVFSNLTFKQLLSDNMNETSTVFRATVGGKSILFTGDINYIGGYMLNKFHAAHASNSSSYYSIKSDYVQVSHHGHYGLPKNTYYTIDADVAMWPVNYDEWNDNDYQNLICTKQWFNDMGAKSYPAYQGPHIFEFPVVRSEGAITVPSALKEYIFDAEYYSAKYPDLAKLYGTDENKLYYHFLNYGIEEGRCASPFFDVTFYANQNGQHLSDTFKGNYIAAFEDFLSKYKTTTLMKLSENFDPTVYKALHTELHNQGIRSNFSLLKHYVANGYPKGEIASTTFLCEDRTMTYHEDCTVTQPVAATCTTAGKTAGIKCNTCGLVLSRSETVPVTGHSEVVDRGTPATCTTAGLSDGAHCSVCNTVTREQTELPPLDHNIVDGACTVCGERYTGTLLDFTPNSPELDYSWTVLKCCEVPTFDTEGSGYMTGKLSASGGETRTDIYIGMLAVNNPDNLNHKIRTADEVFQLRYKLDLDIEIPAENRTKFYLKTGAVAQSAGYSETYQVATTQEVKDEEGYTVVTVQVPENLVGQIIETIRIDLLDYIGYVALEGSYSIDYIYMGPGCTAPNAAHSIITIPGKAPTCTEPGLTDEVYCSLCDEILATQEEIPALGHTVVTQEAVPPTCTNSGLTEGKYCTLCKEVFLAQEVLPRLGHSYSYTELDPQTHQTLCVNCGQSKTNSHSYENGLCVCGAVEIKEPIEDSSLKLSHSLNLASDISVNFVVLKTMLADFDLSTVYVEAEIDMYEGNEKTGTQTLRLEPVDTGYY